MERVLLRFPLPQSGQTRRPDFQAIEKPIPEMLRGQADSWQAVNCPIARDAVLAFARRGDARRPDKQMQGFERGWIGKNGLAILGRHPYWAARQKLPLRPADGARAGRDAGVGRLQDTAMQREQRRISQDSAEHTS